MPYATDNGLNMYYEVHGEGPPLLLLHGGSGSIPEKWIPFFSPPFRVIAMEQMGHGRTADVIDRPFHYHDMAEDTVELMRQLDVESAAIVGYSDGGVIGLDIAIHHPQRVTKLAVTGANARTDGYTAENLEWVRSFDPDTEPVSDAYARLSPDGADHWPIVLRRLQRMWAVEPSFTREQLQCIEAPTLIIVGDGDIVTPEHAVEIFRTIPAAQLSVVPHSGHGVMPKETILTFLQEGGPPARSRLGRRRLRAREGSAMTPAPDQLREFARRYTDAWCSQDPARVAESYAPDGSLTINDGPRSVGRAAITEAARSFMVAFPDMQVLMDEVLVQAERAEYRWTLVGTSTGPGGTGHRVRISGFEEWTFGDDGLIAASLGHYDQADYDRQLEQGLEEPH